MCHFHLGKKIALHLFPIALVSGMLACGKGPTPTPTSSPTPTPLPTATPTPLPVQALGWEEVTVHTLCLEVEQSYPEIEGEFSQSIADTAQRVLARVGLQVVAQGSACDAALTIALISEALGEEYTSGYCYTGAKSNGQILLAAPDRVQFTFPISGFRSPPFNISYCPPEPNDAPFEEAWSEAILEGLAHLWGPRVLIKALVDEEWWMRKTAALALGEIGPGAVEAVPAIIQTMEDEDWVVRWSTAWALWKIGPGAVEAVPALIQALEDEDSSDVRGTAALALGEIGPGAIEAVPALIQALGDGNIVVREHAALALGEIGPGAIEAVPALIHALGDRNIVRDPAAAALKKITGQDFGDDANRWQEWWEEQK